MVRDRSDGEWGVKENIVGIHIEIVRDNEREKGRNHELDRTFGDKCQDRDGDLLSRHSQKVRHNHLIPLSTFNRPRREVEGRYKSVLRERENVRNRPRANDLLVGHITKCISSNGGI